MFTLAVIIEGKRPNRVHDSTYDNLTRAKEAAQHIMSAGVFTKVYESRSKGDNCGVDFYPPHVIKKIEIRLA